MSGASELIKRGVPGPVVDRLRRWRHLVAATVTGGELARLRAELSEMVDARTRDLLARSDDVLSSYDRRVAAVATRVLDLEDRMAGGGPTVAGADSVLAAHVDATPLLLDHTLAADLAMAGRPPPDTERRRLEAYVGLLGEHQPVLDLGCGRGDLLAALHQGGVEAAGVDTNPVLVARARQAGLDAVAEDLFVHLARRHKASLASVTALGVVERMGAGDAARLLRSVAGIVVPGGMVLLETADPSSDAGRTALWRDGLCVRLYAPAMLEVLCRDAGLDVEKVDPAPVGADDDAGAPGAGRYTLVARRR